MSQFPRIAGRFHFGSALTLKEYVGNVYASRDALFLEPEANALIASLGVATGGVVGYAGAKTAQGLTGFSGPMQTTVDQLPRPMTSHADWPLGYTHDPIIVVPKVAVTEIRYPWYSALTAKTAEHRFTISPVVFARGKVLRHLRRLGWPI